MGNTIINLQNITREGQRFFIDTNEIAGIQSIQIQYEINASPLKYLGMTDTKFVPRGAQIGKASLSTLLISDDILLAYTGNIACNGYLVRNFDDFTNNFCFTSGYLTYYHSQGAIGQIPRIDANFDVVGNVGEISRLENNKVSNDVISILNSNPTGLLKLPSYSTVNISLDNIQSNRVLSYDLSINVPRNPIYTLGSRFPIDVKINWPIEILCSFNIELDTYDASLLNNYPSNYITRDLILNINDFYTNNTVLSYNFNQLLLISENYSTNVDGNVTLNAQYKKLINQ